MASIDEIPDQPSQMAGVLHDGQEALSLDQEITFTKYTRAVLPIDRFVYWVKATDTVIKGVLHINEEMAVEEDQVAGRGTARFSSELPIVDFENSPVSTIFLATTKKGLRYAFSQRHGFLAVAGLFHYFGASITPAMQTQLVDRSGQIDLTQAVVSNSLPAWLGLNNYASPFFDGFDNKGVPFKVKPPVLFPSFMVDTNETTPYGTVHIGDNDTEALQAAPYLDSNRSHWQLCSDRVRITLYGLQNSAALDFVDMVNQYTLETEAFGIQNVPVVRDAIRTQGELPQTRAMKKVIDFVVSYNQARINNIARQLIKKAVPKIYISDGAAPYTPLST